LGAGGFGTVFKGLDGRNGRSVAIKRLVIKGLRSENIKEMKKEIRLLSKLGENEHIVQYFDHMQKGDYLYIVME
jgi:serine/threonine-protein kinase 24/25/MST4